MGPYCAGVFDPRSWGSSSKSNSITLEVLCIVLAIGVFSIGVELPKTYMAKHAKSLSAMVVPTMGIGWVIVAGIYVLSIYPTFKLLLLLGLLRVLFPPLDFMLYLPA